METNHAVPSVRAVPAVLEPEPNPAHASNQASKGRLLIVDDIRENREILRRRFERHGYQAVEASGGFEALRLIEREAFDLVLLDMMMPDLSGLEVLARVRSRHSQGSLPVIMVTAKSHSEDVVEALNLGANDYITKPVDFSVALARVITQLSRRQAEEKIRQINEELSRANEVPCPSVSLMALKPSRSMNSTARSPPWWRRRITASLSCWWKSRRLGRSVSASWCARCAMVACERSRCSISRRSW